MYVVNLTLCLTVKAPDLGQQTLLYIAVFLDHERACEWLLQQGATVYPQREVEVVKSVHLLLKNHAD